jgi:hypothetical protein
MGMFGKVLAILNLLAAIGFVALVTLDYSRRNSWSFVVLQADFIIKGLPVDDKEVDAENRPVVSLLVKEMEKALFASGSPVKTQVEEVRKRKQSVADTITGAGDEKAQLKMLADVIVPLARTQGEREDLQRRIAAGKILDLMSESGPFEDAFKDALHGKGGQSNWEGRRQAVAHVLVNLGDAGNNQERDLTVVGLEAYAREVSAQAQALREMLPVLQHSMAEERAAFEIKHRSLLQQVRALADRNRELDESLDKQTALRDEHREVVKKRQDEVTAVQAQIAAAQKATEESLAEQGRLEKELFDAQSLIGATGDTNLKLESQIRSRETGR